VTTTSATWEDADSFINRYPGFQLEDELLVEGGGEMSCGSSITSVDPVFRCSSLRRRVARRDLGKQACRPHARQARIKELVSVVSRSACKAS
jgi:transcriptional regulator GlxA family with amidase domain